ncbi:MAG TPA: periplasmic heavy metal sensor [Orrella sp.]
MKSTSIGRYTSILTLAYCVLFGASAQAQTLHHGNNMSHSPYAGQQNRTITSLSADDQEALSKGEGWGLAKPAELNGVPGPAHLLELGEEIGLSAEQTEQLQKLFRDMKAQAIALGNEYMAAEQALDDYFRKAELSDRTLRQAVDQAEQARANLRFLHLSYHHRTLDVITPEQVQKYNQLRGYDQVMSDPCANVPEGHDPVMFRKHMGCD